jgi:hypothetical protein
MRGTVIGWSDRRGDYEGAFVRKDHEAGGEDGDVTGMGWDHQRKGRAATHRKRAVVRWDRNGDQKGYWLGFRGMYELRHAPVDPKLPLELGRERPRKGFRYAANGKQVAVTDTATKRLGDVVTMRTASVGAHVSKGPHWEHGNQNGGEKAGSQDSIQVGVITKTYTNASSKARRRSAKPGPDDVVERERFPEQRGHEARVLVRWEANGYEDDYRVGQDGRFDLVFAKDEYSPRDKLTPQAVESVGDPGTTTVAPLPRPAPPGVIKGVSCSGQPNDQSHGTRRRKYAYVFLEKGSETVPIPNGDGEPGVVMGTNGSA